MAIFAKLFLNKTGVTETLGSGAYTDAVLATGVGGRLRTSGVAEEWDTVILKQAIKETSDGTDFPYYLSGNSSSPVYTSDGYILGGTGTPEGGVRFDGAKFVNVGTDTPYYVKPDTQYDQAAYIVYTCAADPSKHGLTGLSLSGHEGTTGAGRSGTWVSSPYINITGGGINTPTGDLAAISSGSGMWLKNPVTFRSTVVGRAGEELDTPEKQRKEPLLSGQRVNMMNTDGEVVYADYKVGVSSPLSLTAQAIHDLYGPNTKSFGIEFLTVNNNSGTHKTHLFPYTNWLSISGIKIISLGGRLSKRVIGESKSSYRRYY